MKKLALTLLLSTTILLDESIDVFSATAICLAMEDLKKEFLKERPHDTINFTIGSAGRSYAQFQNGMKFDIFFSADRHYAQAIYENGDAQEAPKNYANGVLTLYARNPEFLKSDLSSLEDSNIRKIAIANPRVSPYGAASEELIQKKYQNRLKGKIVIGENVAQAAHFSDSGAVEVAFVPYALLKNSLKTQGSYIIIDQKLHQPLEHCFVITKSGEKKKLAKEFAAFVLSKRGKEIIQHHGFTTNE